MGGAPSPRARSSSMRSFHLHCFFLSLVLPGVAAPAMGQEPAPGAAPPSTPPAAPRPGTPSPSKTDDRPGDEPERVRRTFLVYNVWQRENDGSIQNTTNFRYIQTRPQ